MGPPTVLHLSDYGGPYSGSFIPMLRAAADAVRAEGWAFRVGFTPIAQGRGWIGDLEADGIEVEIAPGWERDQLRGWVERGVAEVEGPLILHTHFTAFDLPALSIARARAEATAIWHLHSYLPGGLLPTARAALKLAVLGRGAELICVSAATVAAVRRRGASPARIHLIENGIDTGRFPEIGPGERRSARESLGLGPDERALLHFAWDWEVKGGPLFTEVLAALDGDPRWAGLSVGGAAHASAAAARLGLGDRLRPVEPSDDVRALYAAADALLASSVAEGMPFAILESLSSGLPVVATDVAGHRVAAPLPPGLSLAPIDAGALAAAVEAAVPADPEGRGGASAAAHDWVVAERDVKRWAERVVGLYRDVLGR